VWQTAASNLLVAAGHKFTNKVMAELTQHFQPGVLPHFFVVQTLGKLAVASGELFVTFYRFIYMLHKVYLVILLSIKINRACKYYIIVYIIILLLVWYCIVSDIV